MSWSYCDTCQKRRSDKDMVIAQVLRQSHSSPAEYEPVGCVFCLPDRVELDEAYERAASRYDGENGEKDWR